MVFGLIVEGPYNGAFCVYGYMLLINVNDLNDICQRYLLDFGILVVVI